MRLRIGEYISLELFCFEGKARKVDPGKDKSPAAPAGTRTRDLSITDESGVLTTELSPPAGQAMSFRPRTTSESTTEGFIIQNTSAPSRLPTLLWPRTVLRAPLKPFNVARFARIDSRGSVPSQLRIL